MQLDAQTIKDKNLYISSPPTHLRKVSLDECINEFKENTHIHGFNTILDLLSEIENEIEFILSNEINFHNWYVYTKEYIYIFNVEDISSHDHEKWHHWCEWMIKAIPRNPKTVLFTTRKQVSKQAMKDSDIYLKEWKEHRQYEIDAGKTEADSAIREWQEENNKRLV